MIPGIIHFNFYSGEGYMQVYINGEEEYFGENMDFVDGIMFFDVLEKIRNAGEGDMTYAYIEDETEIDGFCPSTLDLNAPLAGQVRDPSRIYETGVQ